MAQINTVATKHGELQTVYSSGRVVEFKPFPNITAVDKTRLATITKAVKRVDDLETQSNVYDSCNLYFQKLPRGMSLRDLWRGNDVFVNFWPTNERETFGATHRGHKDIAVSAWCLDTQSCSMIAATIIHEMAHIAGAPGGDSHMAERAVLKCGFEAEYDPELVGSLELYSYLLQRMG